MKDCDREYFTPHELAAKLNVSVKFVQTQTQARRIPGQVKVGRLWRYNRAEVEKAILKGGQFLRPRQRQESR
jgi:excisionase family DNA binding protein